MKRNVALIGLGQRGIGWAKHFIGRSDADLIAVSDVYPDRVAHIRKLAAEQGRDTIRYAVGDYRELLDKKDIDVVIIATSWENHVNTAIDFMHAGIVTAMEVGGAYDLSDCHRLVQAYEATGTPFFFMENCCYGKRETMVQNMVQQGVLGEIVHCAGSYSHDLREEIVTGIEKRHYRFRNYRLRNCDNYPTHDLGPISKILNLGRGNRMVSLVSVASKSVGLEAYMAKKHPEMEPVRFLQGDVINTVITCSGGETILLTLDTALPRSYSRSFRVRGTEGMYDEDTDSIYLDSEHTPKYEYDLKPLWGNAKEYEEKYLPEIWKQDINTNVVHGGMDELMINDFFRCLDEGLPMPIDVYDAASWMAVSALSEESIRRGGAPVSFPDFTGGRWMLQD